MYNINVKALQSNLPRLDRLTCSSRENPLPTPPDLHWPCVLVAELAYSRGVRRWQASAGRIRDKEECQWTTSFRLLQAIDIAFHLFNADGRLQEELRHYY